MQAPYDTEVTTDVFAEARNTFNCLIGQLTGTASATLTHDRLEETIVEQGRELQRQMLQAHLDLRALRERQQAHHARQDRQDATTAGVTGPDGVARRRLESGHHRLLATVVGTVTVTRCAWRAPGVRNVYPADVALSLPAVRHSAGLARLAVIETVRGSFDAAHASLVARCGSVIGKRQIEQAIVAAAVDVDAFYAAQTPVPCIASTVLAISVDGKGIAMRPEALRPATAKAARARATFRTRLAAGEKPARKRMATLGVVYDAEPAPRRPHDVIAVPGGRAGQRLPRARPSAMRKWLCGSIVTGPGPVIAKVFDHAEARDPGHARPWVVLVDGARHQLDLIAAEAARRGIGVHVVIDFVHVLEKLWAAAWSLHPPAAPAAEDWVAGHALALLAGHTGHVITALTAQASTAGAQRRDGIDACIRYLTNNFEHLRYDQVLEAGWPIATGVIEGACRHLIADRFDLAGARWGLAGAEAVLKLRALIANGHLEKYWHFHLARQHERVHQSDYQDGYSLTA
ncbi:ISKra4 family transposase [Actinomadura sp. ATCC 31491]|uniref:ISKra4 family transposase n=2 Tax=Actinomadura luzonensis TaxID=2805427 RepID=A0ABT0FPQ4_9ACTN|nr:ISKra4 family transposase [Actinomadura luzonensis]MCK2214331.1 ISKra4 family transposase [Actinomadura luzonensis]